MTDLRSKTRIAIVGAGMASGPYLTSLRELGSKVEVTWLAARTTERLAKAAEQLPGARTTTSLDDVIGDTSVQAVFVLTPPNTHLDIVSRCAAAGKHVLVEKPLEIDSPRSRRLVDACASAGVRLGMMLQHRLRPASLAMARLVADGALGEMTSALVDIRWWRPQSYYDVPGRGTRSRDGGGVLITQGIHTLDMYLSIVGAPSQVAAFANTSAAHRMECEDVVAAALRYPNGATATINATTATFPGFPEKVEYSGTLGTATLGSGLLEVRYLDGRFESFGEKQATGFSANPMDFTHHSHQAVIEDFLDAVANDREPTITGASALVVHRLIDVLLESAAARRFVSF